MASYVQNNQLNSSFRRFYKRFTCFLQLFTAKKPQDNWHPVSLLHCFTQSMMVMKICKLSFLLLFQFLFGCNETVEVSASSPARDSKQKQKNDQALAANIVFKSADGGQTWQDISEGLPVYLKEDGIRGNSLFADDKGLFLRVGNERYHNIPNAAAPFWTKETFPCEDSSMAPGNSGKLYWGVHLKKTNGTDVWSPVFESFHEPRIRSVFETAAGAIFIGTDKGFFKTADNGKNWKLVHTGSLAGNMAESDGVLLATSMRRIIKSTDDGENWVVVPSEGNVAFDVKPIKGGFAAITAMSETGTRSLRTSYDAGKTWQPTDAGDKVLIDSIWQTWDDRPRVQAFMTTITQVGENFFCTHPDGVFKSSDKGKTWKLLLPAIEKKVFSLFVSGNVIYAIPSKGGC
jgi:photosystem II stability/assembly factor-like uncharacterized protein